MQCLMLNVDKISEVNLILSVFLSGSIALLNVIVLLFSYLLGSFCMKFIEGVIITLLGVLNGLK